MTQVTGDLSLQQYVTPGAGGGDDESYVRQVRYILRDYPRVGDQQTAGDGSTTRYTITPPINDDAYFSVTVGGSAVPVVTTLPAATGKVFVDFDTGVLIFGTAPPSNASPNIYVTYTRVKRRSGEILSECRAALLELFPKIWQEQVDTSVSLQSLVYDYQLPPIFAVPGVKIKRVEVQPVPSTTEEYLPLPDTYRVGDTVLHVPQSQRYAPGTLLRITFQGPYRSLSELPARYQHLPPMYAAAKLLAGDEALLNRPTNNPAGGQQTGGGSIVNTASWYMARFREAVQSASRPMGMSGYRRPRRWL